VIRLVLADVLGDVAENARRDGEIEGADAILALVEERLELRPSLSRSARRPET
jgi:hypothetical protein